MITVFTGIVIALVFLAIHETICQHYLERINDLSARNTDLAIIEARLHIAISEQSKVIDILKAQIEEIKEDDEDWQTVLEARKSIERYGTISWDEVKQELPSRPWISEDN